MHRFTPLTAVALAVALTACSKKEPEVVDTNPDPMANQIANAAPVELPPALKASVTYRCKDNSLVYVDWFADNKTANVRTEKGGTPVHVVAANPGEPMKADGYSVSGNTKTAEIAVKGKPAQTCNA